MGTLNISLHPLSNMAVVYEQSTGEWRLLKNASAPSDKAVKTEQLMMVDSPLTNVDITVGELTKLLLGISNAIAMLTTEAYRNCEGLKTQYGFGEPSNIIAACPSGQIRCFATPRVPDPSYDMNLVFPIGVRYEGSLEVVYCKDSKGYRWCSRHFNPSWQSAGVDGDIEVFSNDPMEHVQITAEELIAVVVAWLNTFGDISTQAKQFLYILTMLYT